MVHQPMIINVRHQRTVCYMELTCTGSTVEAFVTELTVHDDMQCLYMSTIKNSTLLRARGPGQRSRYRAGRFGVRTPVGGDIFHTRPDRSRFPPSRVYDGYRLLSSGKAKGAWH